MEKYLLISEKPSLMRLVESAFYKSSIKSKIFVDFVALHGHCCTLSSPEEYDPKLKEWTMDTLPIIPEKFTHKPVDEELVKTIQSKLKETSYDGLINCTDAEREGQNIFYSLYDYLGCTLPVKRFWANDLTESRLIDAWENLYDDLKEPFLVNLTNAALLRANLDWLVGMNFSRVVSINNYKNIPVGRVMSVVLSILAKRELEIKNFKPTDSYRVVSEYKQGFNGIYYTDANEDIVGNFLTKKEAQEFIETLQDKAIVTSVEHKKSSEAPRLLYSLGDLQNDANRVYGYTLADTLKYVQTLYEMKISSYPRTDSNYLTTGEAERMDKIISACKCIPEIANIKFTAEMKKNVENYKKSKYVDDSKVQAHYAIVLTGGSFSYDNLEPALQNIVTLVAKRIVATLMTPCVKERSEIIADIKGNNSNNNQFVSLEEKQIDVGWKLIYGRKNEEPSSLHKYKEGDSLDVNQYLIETVTTICPSRYTDASINRAMVNVGSTLTDKELAQVLKGTGSKDSGGIGTPATRSQIIEKLLLPKSKKNPNLVWVKRKGKSFYVTDEGLNIYAALKDYSVSSAMLTAIWEQRLSQVAEGKMDTKKFNELMISYIQGECENLKKVYAASGKTKNTVKVLKDVKCPFCDGEIKESDKYFYCSNYKKEDGCTFILSKDFAGTKITQKDIEYLCEKKESPQKEFTSKTGKKFKAKLIVGSTRLEFKFPEKIVFGKCSCGGDILEKNGQYGKYYTCENCTMTVNGEVFGKKLKKKEIEDLFSGKTVSLYGLKSKSGKTFNANVSMQDKKIKILNFIN